MKTVWLHIGIHKTGTSSVQAFFNRNEVASVEYPRVCLGPYKWDVHSHHNVAWELRDDRRFSEDRGRIKDLVSTIEASTAEDVFISSEELCLLNRSQIEMLANSLAGLNVRILYCTRNQVDFLDSMFNQIAKKNTNITIPDFLEHYLKNDQRLYFPELHDSWSDFFGASNVFPLVYEEEVDIVASIARIVGFELPAAGVSQRINSSVQREKIFARQLAVQALYSYIGRDVIDHSIVTSAFAYDSATSVPKLGKRLLSVSQAQTVLSQYRESNRRFDHYVKPLPGEYFRYDSNFLIGDDLEAFLPFVVEIVLNATGQRN